MSDPEGFVLMQFGESSAAEMSRAMRALARFRVLHAVVDANKLLGNDLPPRAVMLPMLKAIDIGLHKPQKDTTQTAQELYSISIDPRMN